MRIQQSKTLFAGSSLMEEFEFHFKNEFDHKIDDLEELRNKGVNPRYYPLTPDNWKTLTPTERQDLVKDSEFELQLKCIYFHNECAATKLDVVFLLQFPELEDLIIWGEELDWTDIKKFRVFKRLSSLVLVGRQFGDEIIPHILGFRRLRQLDIQTTSISPQGIEELRSKILKRTRVWYPAT